MTKKTTQFPKATTSTIDRLSHDGRGITTHQGKVVFVTNALPGETVKIAWLKQHRHYDEAETLEILQASPDRLNPPCPHYKHCGGCQWQHAPNHLVLAQKELNTRHLLAGLLAPNKLPTQLPIQSPILGPEYAYRRRARLGIQWQAKTHTLTLGFREGESHQLTPIEHCSILENPLNELIKPLTQALEKIITKNNNKNHFTHAELIQSDDGSAVCLRLDDTLTDQLKDDLIALAKELNIILFCHYNNSNTDLNNKIIKIFPCKEQTTHFSDYLSYKIIIKNEITHSKKSYSFDFMPEQFIQVNKAVNNAMVEKAIELLELNNEDNVLDLFCGLGNFSLPLADQAKWVTGVEANPSAIELAKHNAEKNNCNNVEFFCEDLSTYPLSGSWAKARYNKVMLDPPRQGASALMPGLKTWSPSILVYVSCNPSTFARDAKALISLGYRLENMQLLDMFPQTKHSEIIAKFKLKK
jgi:23S rRNA (uracil1939-C5)-methyltransferase